MTGRASGAVAGLVAVSLLSGCGPTLFDLPRPGGGIDGASYEITLVFADALNLPDGARVRVAGAEVGKVRAITTRDYVARVTVALQRGVVLTDKATAQLRLTTPLGEGYIVMDPGKGTRNLAEGAVVPASATNTAASVEDLLAAASVLLSGGGLGQIRTITVELQKVLSGPKGDPAKLLKSLNDTLAVLNERTGDIDKTLDALDTLAGTLVDRRATLRAALGEIAPAAKLLADQTDRFSELLVRVAELGRVGDRIVRATREDLLSTLKSAQPVLDALLSIEKSVGPTLRQLVKFGKFLDDATPADYLTGDADFTAEAITGGATGDSRQDLTLRRMMRGAR
ncbi:MAG: MCE family protein [Sporichthyaceae bacterium]